jgi:hypothetical protein
MKSTGYGNDGAQGRNRTTDTVIFSHVLYQLSYLGDWPRRDALARLIGVGVAPCPVPDSLSPPRHLNQPSRDCGIALMSQSEKPLI